MIETVNYTCPTCKDKYNNWDLEMLGPHHCIYVTCARCKIETLYNEATLSNQSFFCLECVDDLKSDTHWGN